MIIKKIMAGVLAAASVLAVSATASAVEAPDKTKAITKPGETEYEAGVSAMTAELDVELPAQMKAFINPYGAEVAISEKVGTTEAVKTTYGVLSWAYEVVNNTEDYGIMIDIKDGIATVPADVTLTTPAATLDDKKIGIALVSAKDAATLFPSTFAPATASAKAAATAGGKFVFTNAKTSQPKFAYAPAKTKDDGAGKVYIGFQGIAGKKYAAADATKGIAAGDPVDWSDAEITCTYVLKINPAAKTAATADFS